jgi:hypothetical protein
LQQETNKRILRPNRKKKNLTTEEQHLDGGLVLKPFTVGTQILNLSCIQEVKERTTHLQSTTTSVTLPGFFRSYWTKKKTDEVQAEKENGSIGIRGRGEYERQWRRTIREVCK